MNAKYTSEKFPSDGRFYQPFLCKAKWTSHHINKTQRLLNLKVEKVEFFWAVPPENLLI